jgi:hypothetical protein
MTGLKISCTTVIAAGKKQKKHKLENRLEERLEDRLEK